MTKLGKAFFLSVSLLLFAIGFVAGEAWQVKHDIPLAFATITEDADHVLYFDGTDYHIYDTTINDSGKIMVKQKG